MKAVLFSDAHIRGHDDPNLAPLIAFLESLHGQVDRVVVVGDLFHTWFGFRSVVFDEYVPLLGALHSLRRSGVEIVYVTGNHDFEPGRYLEEILRAEMHDTEMVLRADGQKAYVAHGDLVDTGDRQYRFLRRLLRNRTTRWIARRLPPSWIWRIAQWLSVQYAGDQSDTRKSMAGMFRAYAASKLKEGYSIVILGHLHLPAFERIAEGPEGGTYINLGDWMRWRTFLRWDDGELTMKEWQWPGGGERDFKPPPPEIHGAPGTS